MNYLVDRIYHDKEFIMKSRRSFAATLRSGRFVSICEVSLEQGMVMALVTMILGFLIPSCISSVRLPVNPSMVGRSPCPR